VGVWVGVEVGVRVGVAVAVGVGDGVWLAVGLAVGVGVALFVGTGVADGGVVDVGGTATVADGLVWPLSNEGVPVRQYAALINSAANGRIKLTSRRDLLDGKLSSHKL
jgi:hypothetical protein